MVDAKLRAWWSYRQGCDGSLTGRSAAEVLASTGWARSVGGASPYLSLFARAGIRRAEADRALAAQEIHELPSARGCTYVLPAQDFALGLKVGAQFANAELQVARKLGVTDEELVLLSEAVLKVLASGPLDPEGLRAAVGSATRSLGPEGVKKGITTTLPVALRRMQVNGDIRRIPVNGRLDQQRYKYALWETNPLKKWKLDEGVSFTELARTYFRWTGGATVAEFQWFSGLGVKASKAAVEPLGLVALCGGYLALPEDRDGFEAFRTPKQSRYTLVSSLDGVGQLRRDMKSLLAPEDADSSLLAAVKGLSDMPDHGIMDRGRLVGFWQFDCAESRIVWITFAPADNAVHAAVEFTEAFIREDLDDFRSFSLDSPKSRVPRIQALRDGRIA